MNEWQDMLARVRARWTTAIEQGDTFTLRTMLLKAAVFAACTAHTTVEQAEREYTEWCDTGEFPVDGTNLAGQKASAVMTADDLTLRFTLEDFREIHDGWQLAAILQQNVYGLGNTKASFAAALVGFPEPYCLDTHGLQKVQRELRPDLTLDQLRGRCRRWKFYREVGDAVFGSRDAQWSYFAQVVPEFAEGGHRAFFQTVL
jgi:hypothetical protein